VPSSPPYSHHQILPYFIKLPRFIQAVAGATMTQGRKRSFIDTAPKKDCTEVIESIGFGWYQTWQVILTGLVYFELGCYVSMASMSTSSIAGAWNLNSLQKSLLTSFFFLGNFTGSLFSGRIGDRWGRKWPIVMANVVMTVVGFFSSFSPNWIVMAVFRIVEGMAVGFGIPAICAMTSEISPENWKIPMRAIGDGSFEIGFIYTAILGLIDEPSLQHMHWRALLMIDAVPGVLALMTFCFLRESPAFLASKGKDHEAKEILAAIWRANKGSNSEPRIDYEPCAAQEETEKDSQSALAEYKVVFGMKYLFNTFSFSFICACINIHFYGGLYMQAQVLGTQSEKVAPALQLAFGGFVDLIGVSLAIIVSRLLSRKAATIFGLLSCAISTIAFGVAGSFHGRGPWLEGVFQLGDFGFYWVPSMMFVVVYQFAIDTYPIEVAATATGVVVASGRIGAIIGPQVHEYLQKWTGQWNGFCWFVAAAALIGVFCVIFIKDPGYKTSGRSSSKGSTTYDNEKKPLLDKIDEKYTA